MAMKVPFSFQGTIPFRNSGQCIRHRYLRPSATARYLSTTSPLRSSGSNNNPLRTRANVRSREEEIAKSRRSMIMSAAGIAACAVAMYGVIKLDMFGLEQQQGQKAEEGNAEKNASAMKTDGPDGFTSHPSVIRIQGQEGVEQVPTGTSSVPLFPTTIQLPKYQGKSTPSNIQSGDEVIGTEEEEYQLLGLGIRTVSFLRIQVYVVGLYVAKSDIVELQQRLVQVAVNPPSEEQVISNPVGATSATSLVSTERQLLKELLLDEEKGEDVWNALLKDDGLRTAFRIVPTRNTDFLHLRDGWVRGITARAQKANLKAKAAAQAGEATPLGEYQDESFGSAMNDFKGLFGGGQRKNVPKGQTLVLMRSAHGELDALFQPDAAKPFRFMGRVSDERIGRLVWLNYLAGKNVSSEDARRSVVDGVMGIVERPIGTIVQKIV